MKPRPQPMPLTRVQMLWLGALIAAAQLPQIASIPPWVAATGLSLTLSRLIVASRRRDPDRAADRIAPTWLLALLALAVAIAIRISYGYLLGREPCLALLFSLVGIKYIEARSTRDGVVLVCLASFLLITPFFHSQSLYAALIALPVVLLIATTLDVLARDTGPGSPAEPWQRAVLRSIRLIVYGIPLAALLFVLFPRLAGPLWGLPADHLARTGLSDRMAPGSIGELSLSDEVVFRVDFDGAIPPPEKRYWRGPVLSRFDGREWSLAMHRPTTPSAVGPGEVVDYTVTLEPHDTPWLFALELPSALPRVEGGATGGANPAEPLAGLTSSQQLIARAPVTQPLRYRQQSRLLDRYPADRPDDVVANLRLPRTPGFNNPRTVEFARALRAGQPDDEAFIGAVLSRFNREPFVYTLSPPLLDRNPVDAFLFDSRSGFCEHYASAFVVLMRAAGIPARVVTGYQGGEINPSGGYMIVRQSDAHAWAEVLVVGEWRRFDPTAAVAPSRIRLGLGGALPDALGVPLLSRLDAGWLKSVQLAWDAVNHDWRRRVIGFNYTAQRELFQEWKLDGFAPWQLAVLVSTLALAWTGLALLWLGRRRRVDRATALWQAYCARLARAGLTRHGYEGPVAFCTRAGEQWVTLGPQMQAIGETYATLRYGPESMLADTNPTRAAVIARLAAAIAALPNPPALRALAIRPAADT